MHWVTDAIIFVNNFSQKGQTQDEKYLSSEFFNSQHVTV